MTDNPFDRIPIPCDEVLGRPCPVPPVAGVYGWFFKELPPFVLNNPCVEFGDLTLLYVGIAPSRHAGNGKISSQNLRTRVRYHVIGNAEGSTLRLTLGCLLSESLGIQLRRVGNGKRMTFTIPGEQRLSEWMHENAFVTWIEISNPWEMENSLISNLSLPFNLINNKHHPFAKRLKGIHSEARSRARSLPIVPR